MNIKTERLEITEFTLDKIKIFKVNPSEKRLNGTGI